MIKLLAIAASARFRPAPARHLPFAGRSGKSRYINFPITGFNRGIRHPLSIGGNLDRCDPIPESRETVSALLRGENQEQTRSAVAGAVLEHGVQNLLIIQRPESGEYKIIAEGSQKVRRVGKEQGPKPMGASGLVFFPSKAERHGHGLGNGGGV